MKVFSFFIGVIKCKREEKNGNNMGKKNEKKCTISKVVKVKVLNLNLDLELKNFEVKLEGIKKECETFPFPKF